MEKIDGKTVFATTELGLACYLSAMGIKFLGIKPAKGTRGLFTFSEPQRCEMLLEGYWGKAARVEPIAHYYEITRIKASLRGFLNNTGNGGAL